MVVTGAGDDGVGTGTIGDGGGGARSTLKRGRWTGEVGETHRADGGWSATRAMARDRGCRGQQHPSRSRSGAPPENRGSSAHRHPDTADAAACRAVGTTPPPPPRLCAAGGRTAAPFYVPPEGPAGAPTAVPRDTRAARPAPRCPVRRQSAATRGARVPGGRRHLQRHGRHPPTATWNP